MSSDSVQVSFHVVGTPHANTNTHPTVETKPTPTLDDSGRVQTGGGYEHARSTEYRPHTSRQGKESVYASIHRLCAVAWCFEDGATAADIDMAGMDVHHESGVEWDNREDNLEVMSHGEHSSVTATDKRAWGEDAKRTLAEASEPDRCPDCGDEPETWASSPAVDGFECLRCVTRKTDGGAIEVGR